MDIFILNLRWGNYSRVDNRLLLVLGYCIIYVRVYVNVYWEWFCGSRGWGCWRFLIGVWIGYEGREFG